MIDKRVAIVTGGTRGIGAEISLELAKIGDVVLSVYRSNDEKAASFLKEIQAVSPESNIYKADVGYKSEVMELVDFTIKKFGRIDILVNNAGIFDFAFMDQMEEDFFDDIIRTNLKSLFLMTQACGQHMKNIPNGRIINASSISGDVADVGLVGYGASKAAVNMMTKISAAEYAPFGITVNAYAPGIIHTDLTDGMIRERGEIQVKQIPLNRFGKGTEVASLVRFLASEEAGYITGEIIGIDGGMLKVQNPFRAHDYVQKNKD